MDKCRICKIIKERSSEILLENEKFIAISDARPVTKGHTIVTPKKHVVSFFDQTDEDEKELYQFLKELKIVIDKKNSPDGYNIGINDGRAAGRSIDHLHVHVIPRYSGDITEPKGGVRNLLGKNAPYES